jgi:creatinine amidohydrolase/Fe(II)-dependent formamide hydrolase-like protein
MPGVELELLTSAEAGRLGSEGRVVGLIATGAVEQHGPHLPLGTDAIIARHLAGEVAARLQETVVVAPVLPGGLSSHHLAFPGTVDLVTELFSGYVRALLGTFERLGIRDVALFSAHGGNFGALAQLAAEHAGHEGLRVIAYSDLAAYLDVMSAAAAAAGLHAVACDAHAGALETSQMLFLSGPARIAVPPGLEGYVACEPGWMERLAAEGIQALSANGVLGRPADATADAGAAICAALADAIAAWMAAELALERPRAAARM